MVKVLPFKFQQCFGAFTMLLSEESSKTDFLAIDLGSFFGVCNFGHKAAMWVIFFLKMFQI